MTPAQFRALAATLTTADGVTAAAAVVTLLAELTGRGLTDDEARSILDEVVTAEVAKVEAARVAARASKLAAVRTALGLP